MATLATATEILLSVFDHNRNAARASDQIVPILVGDPGIGKTTAIEDAAEALGVEYQNVIVGQYDPTELAGFPVPDMDDGVMRRLRPLFLPNEGEGILNLDEIVQGVTMIQNLCAQLTNERRIGEHKLGDGWMLCATGNKMSNRAGTSPMPTHLRDRLTFIEVEVDYETWETWAMTHGIRPEVIGFINFDQSFLSRFDRDAQACPSPRSWSKVSHILSMDLSPVAENTAIAGCIGDGPAATFAGYLEMVRQLPIPRDVFASPTTAMVPGEGQENIAAALCSALASQVTTKQAKAFTTYLSRLDQQEFAAFAVRAAIKRDKKLLGTEGIREWMQKHGSEFIAD